MTKTFGPTISRLQGRVAIVTGAGHGLGRAYAWRLAEEGASVVAADIDDQAAKNVAEAIESAGHSAVGVFADIADESAVDGMVRVGLDRFGKIEVLVNNASIFRSVPMDSGSLDETSAAEFERVLRVNVVGTWLCTRRVVADMKLRSYGKIINISSTRALRTPAGRAPIAHYTASKAAVLGLTRAMARELGPFGIRVNAIAPGSTLSQDDLNDATLEEAGNDPQVLERAIRKPQVAEDVVGTMAFLASSDSDFITGQTLVVDGGALMH